MRRLNGQNTNILWSSKHSKTSALRETFICGHVFIFPYDMTKRNEETKINIIYITRDRRKISLLKTKDTIIPLIVSLLKTLIL